MCITRSRRPAWAVRRPLLVSLTTSLTLLLTTGCPQSPGVEGDSDQKPGLARFQSANEMLTYFRNQARRQNSPGFGRGLLAFAENDVAGAPTSGNDDPTYTGTNLQEADVDEGDFLKSDGTYFYIASGESLRIVRATPASELGEIARLDLGVDVREMYLDEDRLLVLGQKYAPGDGGPEILIWPPYRAGSEVEIIQIDLADRASPTLVNRVSIDGSLASSRVTNGRLILVLTVLPQLPNPVNTRTLGNVTLDDVLPRIAVNGNSAAAVDWSETLRPVNPDGYTMTVAVTLDAADITQKLASVGVLAGAGTIYSSSDALYVTDTSYDAADNYRERTAIHKFAYDADGAARYVASGGVAGRLLNQFSLGEKDGYLRVATYVQNNSFFGGTTVSDAPSDTAVSTSSTAQGLNPPPSNSIYVLGQVGEELTVQGRIEGIAPNERIYSARFLGDRGFLVTFRQIDPLFTLDLSDPADPRVVGELKIPGYSEYLHPWGENYLIGLGRAVSVTPWGGVVPDALQLSLFDVSDFANPTLVEQIEIGDAGSWWEASNTHKAFTFQPETGLLALPATVFQTVGASFDGAMQVDFEGVLCFQVDPENGFTEIGRIETPAYADGVGIDWYYTGGWKRAAIIGDAIFGVTSNVIRAVSAGSFDEIKAVELSR